MKKTISIFVFILLLFPVSSWASECSTPRPEWLFSSCWETALGSSDNAIQDGGKWDGYHISYYPNDYMTVINNPPAGGPGGNALKTHYIAQPDPTSITGNDTWFCLYGEPGQNHPWLKDLNPLYIRIYWYSTWPPDVWTGNSYLGRKFIYLSDQAGVGATFVLGLYGYATNNNPSDHRMKLVMKNHTFDNEYYNQKDSEHLDGSYAWSGQQDTGIIEENTWYCIELGIYKHPTQGWIKLWKNGKLVINANKDVPGWGGSYDTSTHGNPSTWLRIPAFRNGGTEMVNDEYFSHAVVSGAYIGPVGYLSDSAAPAAPKNFKTD
jgi:hypothetical protein